MNPVHKAKLGEAAQRLKRMDSVLVALSGGQDSALVAKIATETLGANARAATLVSPLLSGAERERADAIAAEIGIPHEHIEVDILECESVTRNFPDRCYHCKKRLFEALSERARALGLAGVCDGSNADDKHAFRPGMRALWELGVESPLAKAGMGKDDIVTISRELGLSTWEVPSSACLASRIAYGTPLTAERLCSIEQAENAVRARGLRQCRVRMHHEVARIEVPPEDFATVVGERDSLSAEIHAAGFRYVTLDLDGFRSGSLDEGLR